MDATYPQARGSTSADRTNTLVILLAPEAMHGRADAGALTATLDGVPGCSARLRVLLCLHDEGAGVWAAALREAGFAFEALLAHGVEPPAGAQRCVHMPEDMPWQEMNEFALALSDVVLMSPASASSEAAALIERAGKLGKPLVEAGAALPEIIPLLCPGGGSWLHPRITANTPASAHFAPPAWRLLALDMAAVDAGAPIVARFEVLDRSATFWADKHRSGIARMHFAAALAVVFALLGKLFETAPYAPVAFAVMDLLFLLYIPYKFFRFRAERLHLRWTAWRLAAEQLRIARTCLPLLVLPVALQSVDIRPSEPAPTAAGPDDTGDATRHKAPKQAVFFANIRSEPPAGDTTEMATRAIADLKRTVRDQGLPHLRPDISPARRLGWLGMIVADQADYHRKLRARLERTCTYEEHITRGSLIAAIAAAIGDLVLKLVFPDLHERSGLALQKYVETTFLVLAAGGPAVAAAAHGLLTRLGVVRRMELSQEVSQILDPLYAELTLGPGLFEPAELRRMAARAATAMGSENTSWHGLVRTQRDAIVV